MPDRLPYDYAIVRVVPKVEREEFVNVGVIVSCPTRKFLQARIELDESRVIALDPTIDLELVRQHLDAIPTICAGGKQAGAIGQLPQRERFHWLVAPRSTIIQTSRVHTGLCEDLTAVLEDLLNKMVRPTRTDTIVVPARIESVNS
ncbi:DUF3037 domain-containing protein [Leptolyngbya sp. FACHB-17]|uniref:DUF3037 domain-containing protein n=1 Tax=unclassified Leptolyngbya TaxID=2650499 RepID=UPI0016813F05|nr:DUF3037 domain-containing protein [Leptolyngbya sp. FACHB-17]